MSQRRIALLLGINRKTVVRKLLFLAEEAKAAHREILNLIEFQSLKEVQFDEMESSVHSKCLPVSIPMVVQSETRKILGLRVCIMPARGPLAAISKKKYGFRPDHRAPTARDLLEELRPILHPQVQILSDQNPKYPVWIKQVYPTASHRTVKGQRGCVVGQGELKKTGFDPLFSFNHTAAMLRANVNRLFRRTWCTSKRLDRLAAHLALYVQFHNETLTV